jgi:hypothetical protein
MVLDEGRIPAIWADLSRQDAAAVHVPRTHLGLHIEAWFNVSDAGAYYAYDLANVLAGPFLGLYPPGTSRVNHAVMDLKFHAGGHEPQTLSPGVPVVARMEFYPQDVAIPAGDELALRIVPDTGLDPCTNANNPAGEDTIQGAYLPGQSPAPPEILWGGESSVLRLPVIHRDVGDGKYDGQPT